MVLPRFFNDKKIDDLVKRREKAVQILLKRLDHLPRERQLAIITSYMTLDELERCAEAQKHR